MATLLHIVASPRVDRSHSRHVADAFLDAYRQAHPDDTVETLDLWSEDLPPFDGEVINAKYAVLHGKPHNEAEAAAWQRVVAMADRFKAPDKYLFSLPMWNFGIPYKLKHYIDVIAQPGLTFAVSPEGQYSGLVTGKPAAVVYARGGAYSSEPARGFDFQKPYLEFMLGFFGFTDVRPIVVEPTLAGDPKQARETANAQAVEVARAL